jgi:hypothetical protein
MAELVGQVASLTGLFTLLVAIGVFSIAPQVVLRLLVLSYPKQHPRRKELVGELAIVELWKKPFFVGELLVAVPCEGIPIRWQERRKRARAKAEAAAHLELERVAIRRAVERRDAEARASGEARRAAVALPSRRPGSTPRPGVEPAQNMAWRRDEDFA